MGQILLIAHNLRSCHNVGSLLRTAEGLGIREVILSGYTPYPKSREDERLPHMSEKIAKQVNKTALGAENLVRWHYQPDIGSVFTELRRNGWQIAAVEQSPMSVKLPDYQPPERIALLVGRETEGIELQILAQVDTVLEIPMFGHKESFNVVQAAAMALYHCRFYT